MVKSSYNKVIRIKEGYKINMSKVKLLVAGLLILPVFSFAIAGSGPMVTEVAAQPESLKKGAEDAKATGAPEAIDGDSGVVTDMVNLFLYIIGIIAVIMLIFGGFQYLTSAGNQEKVKSAKNTILYAIIGLVIAIFAYAIINWVITQTGDGA